MTKETIRPFAATIQDHRKGRLAAELAEKLNELVEAVTTIKKGGKLTLVLTVKPAAKLSDMVSLTDDIKLDLPKPDGEVSLFFVDSDANLTRKSPTQPDLPLRQVEMADAAGEQA